MTLEIALILASVAVVILVACIIPLAIQAVRWLESLVISAEQLKANIQVLLQDSRDLVKNVNTISKQVEVQMEDITKVVHTAQKWTERADWLANEVASVIEPPVMAFVSKTKLLNLGISTFFQVLFRFQNRNQEKNINNQTTKEE